MRIPTQQSTWSTIQFLIATDCKKLLSGKLVYSHLQQAVDATLHLDSEPHGAMVVRATLKLYGVIELPFRLRDRALTKMFLVSNLAVYPIFGMPFLVEHY